MAGAGAALWVTESRSAEIMDPDYQFEGGIAQPREIKDEEEEEEEEEVIRETSPPRSSRRIR